MDKFNSEALNLLKGAVFQDKSFLVIANRTSDSGHIAYRGQSGELISIISKAMDEDPLFESMMVTAIHRNDSHRSLEKIRV